MTPEVLAPINDMQTALAAIHGGADAMYLGMPGFNARGRAKDLSFMQVKEIINIAHLYGVKVFLAFNIVVFQNEWPKVEVLIKKASELSPDAFIVQDLGLARLLQNMAPGIPVHASTQMTVTHHFAMDLLADLNIKRYVLGRENSLEEIKIIREHNQSELEVFVHGALCVAYSGQCFTSESMGGRSANRGQCAQSCRLPYELIIDQNPYQGDKGPYMVSPQDLLGIDQVEALQALNVNSFKIEGRLKDATYIGTAAQAYATKIHRPEQYSGDLTHGLKRSYSRGFYNGWLEGVNHQKLVQGDFSHHRGEKAGVIRSVHKNHIQVEWHLDTPPQKGMGVMCAKTQAKEWGARIYDIKILSPSTYTITFSQKDRPQTKVGDYLFITDDPMVDKLQKAQVIDKNKQRRIPITWSITARSNTPLFIELKDQQGHTLQYLGDQNIVPATQRATTEEDIKKEFNKLGGSVYQLHTLNISLNDKPYLPARDLKKIRQQMIQDFNDLRMAREPQEINTVNHLLTPHPKNESDGQQKLHLLLRHARQIQVLAQLKAKGIDLSPIVLVSLDFEFGKDYKEAITAVRALGLKVAIATTRILKPGELHHFKLIERLAPDAVLVRNLGALQYFRKTEFTLWGDFGLNATNHLSVNYLLEKGLDKLCLSYDLNHTQIDDLLKAIDPSRVEITLHQYMPEFHMEHCVFAAYLSKGQSFRDCGRPCEKHEVQLIDPYKGVHILKADAECRNTLFKEKAHAPVQYWQTWKEIGAQNWRVEALDEKNNELMQKVELYLEFFAGHIDHQSITKKFDVLESYGVCSGQVGKSSEYHSRPQA